MLKTLFHFLIVAVDKSLQSVDGVFFQLNYAVDGCVTNVYRKKEPLAEPFRFLVTLWKQFRNFLDNK